MGHNHLCFPIPQTETNYFKNTNIVHVYCITYTKSGRLNNILVNIGVMYEGWNFNNGNYVFTTDTK